MELFERDHFIQELQSARAAARAGVGSVVLVCGEAGIGKTALVERFAALVDADAMRCLRGACDAFYTPRVLGPLHDIARSAGGRFEALAQPHTDRERLFSLLLDELRRPEGTAVIIEDVHWADEATLDLLRFLARRIRDTHAVLVITFRDDELPPRHPLRSVLAVTPRAATRRITLTRLSKEVVDAMAARAGRFPDGLYALTGGNPFFVTEVLASDGAVPASVADAVYARAARLSPDARAVLDAVSLAPRELERWLLDAVVRPPAAAIDEALAAGILEAHGDALAFRHEIARRAWQDTVEPGRARELHALMLAAIVPESGRDIPMTRLVHHAAGAGDRATLVRLAPLAGEEAAQLGAHREAAAHYQTALDAAADMPAAARAALLEALTTASFLSGQPQQARTAAEQALALRQQLADAEGQCRSLRWLSRLAWYESDSTGARRFAEAALSIAEREGPSAELAYACSTLAARWWEIGELHQAAELARRGLEIAKQVGSVRARANLLATLGGARLAGADEGGRADLERSCEIAAAHGLQDDAARAWVNLAELSLELRQATRAVHYTSQAVRYCTDLDLGPLAACAIGNRGLLRMWRGDWNAATDDAEYALAYPRALPLNCVKPLVVLGLVRARRGDPGVGNALDEAARIAGDSQEQMWRSIVVAARAEAAWLDGRIAVARGELEAAYALALAQGATWRVAELASWLALADGIIAPEVIERSPSPFAAQLRGDWPTAAAEWEELGFPYEQALALGRCDDPANQHEGFAILHRLGARRAAEAIARELRGRGVRHIPRGPRTTTRSNPAHLTARQQRVLALLAEGLSNAEIARRLFITPKTAEHHVGAILLKLDAASRAEAVQRARELGLTAAPAT